MPRYFVDVRDICGIISDEEGKDYVDLEAALDEAKASAGDLVKQYIDQKIPLIDTCIEVRDDSGCRIAIVTVAEVLRYPLHPYFTQDCPGIPAKEGVR